MPLSFPSLLEKTWGRTNLTPSCSLTRPSPGTLIISFASLLPPLSSKEKGWVGGEKDSNSWPLLQLANYTEPLLRCPPLFRFALLSFVPTDLTWTFPGFPRSDRLVTQSPLGSPCYMYYSYVPHNESRNSTVQCFNKPPVCSCLSLNKPTVGPI